MALFGFPLARGLPGTQEYPGGLMTPAQLSGHIHGNGPFPMGKLVQPPPTSSMGAVAPHSTTMDNFNLRTGFNHSMATKGTVPLTDQIACRRNQNGRDRYPHIPGKFLFGLKPTPLMCVDHKYSMRDHPNGDDIFFHPTVTFEELVDAHRLVPRNSIVGRPAHTIQDKRFNPWFVGYCDPKEEGLSIEDVAIGLDAFVSLVQMRGIFRTDYSDAGIDGSTEYIQYAGEEKVQLYRCGVTIGNLDRQISNIFGTNIAYGTPLFLVEYHRFDDSLFKRAFRVVREDNTEVELEEYTEDDEFKELIEAYGNGSIQIVIDSNTERPTHYDRRIVFDSSQEAVDAVDPDIVMALSTVNELKAIPLVRHIIALAYLRLSLAPFGHEGIENPRRWKYFKNVFRPHPSLPVAILSLGKCTVVPSVRGAYTSSGYPYPKDTTHYVRAGGMSACVGAKGVAIPEEMPDHYRDQASFSPTNVGFVGIQLNPIMEWTRCF